MLKDSIEIKVPTVQERDALFGARKKRWIPSRLSDTSLCTPPDTPGFLEGKQVGGRRKEKGNERGKERGEGTWLLYINLVRVFFKFSTQHQSHSMCQQFPYTCIKTIN